MNASSSLDCGCFNLLTEALENILAAPDQPCHVRSQICERIRKVTGAKVVALLGGGEASVQILDIHPSGWRARLETPAVRALLERTAMAAQVAYWPTEAGNPPLTSALENLAVTNALAVPLLDGAIQTGALLALGIDPVEDVESLRKAMHTLSRVLGLLMQDTRLRHEPDGPRARPAEGDGQTPPNHSRAIFDAVNDAILVHEVGTGAILDVNQRLCEMFGLTYDEALWMDMGSLSVGLSPCTQDDAWKWMRKAVTEGPQTFEWIAKHKSGRLFWIEINLRVANIGGQERLLSTARDITDRKRMEAEQTARLKRSEAQNAVFLALAGVGLDYEMAMELITHHLAIQVGDLCVLNILDENKEFLQSTALDQAYIDGRPFLPDFKALPPFPIGTPGAGAVARDGMALQIADPTGEQIKALTRAEFHPYLDHFGVHSLLVVPMRSQGEPIGTITLARCGSTRPYSAEDLAMLQNLADRSALTLVNARLYSENLHQAELLRKANAELEQRVTERTAELEQAMHTLHRMAVEDGLTGLANRRRFNEVMEEEIRRARRSGTPLSLLMCDVDFFKRYNDAYGHQGGDDCLRMVGAVFREVFKRAGELPARYGGEEFAAVLPGVTSGQAQQAGERLRQAIVDRNLPHRNSDVASHVTLSIGVSSATKLNDETTADWFIAKADEALYKSKADGRNRVTLA